MKPEPPKLEMVCECGCKDGKHRALVMSLAVLGGLVWRAVVVILLFAASSCADAPRAGTNNWSDEVCDYLRSQSEAQVQSCREFCTNEPEACNEGKACPNSDIRRWIEARPRCPKSIYYPAPKWPPVPSLIVE